MSKHVTTMNGTAPGTDNDDLVKYGFSGQLNDMFDGPLPEVGTYRVFTITAECVDSGHKKNRDGSYQKASWAVRSCNQGRDTEPPAKPDKKSKKDEDHDPDQMTVDEAIADAEKETDPDHVVDAEVIDGDEDDAPADSNNYDPFTA